MRKYVFLFSMALSLFSISVYAETKYAIYVDAGSTSSRVHLYRYDTTSALPVIKEVSSSSVKPGLSSYADKPDAAGPAFKKALDEMNAALEKEGVDQQAHPVSMNVLATAGMRLLPHDKQQAIYAELDKYIRDHYMFAVKNSKTIDGKMEGVYGWLDVNYLLGNFEANKKTMGSIDMGGASTQITFAVNDDSKVDDQVVVMLNHQRYTVFSKSFLKMGQDQARDAMMAYPSADACYPKGYQFTDARSGKFDLYACGAIYTDIIAQKNIAQQIPSTKGQAFVAYSGIYFGYHFFDITAYDQAAYEARVNEVCSRSWSELKKEYASIEDKYLSTYCANGAYHSKLLYETYQIDGASRLMVANQINQQNIDWTLGALLYDLSE